MTRHLTDGVNTQDRSTALWTAGLYLTGFAALGFYWIWNVFA